MGTATRRRLTAAERREDLLTAAIAEFGVTGYHGTSTETIAERAGISQPYLFRLYGTKKELFLACVDRCFDLTIDVFRKAVADPPADAETPRAAMGRAYIENLGNRDLVLFQHQTYAAADDPDVRALARRRFEELVSVAAELAGFDEEERVRFTAQGMLLNVIAALGLPAEEWVFLSADS
ncbi:MAG TPA: TetR/AcrR family transcriptional regulator [Solirubrobacteraceae bacterium]|nr:TetR/AcrR family transcriptional regulator [Solirubrobacteraceae bacterium]